MIQKLSRKLLPPAVLSYVNRVWPNNSTQPVSGASDVDLDVYWDPQMAQLLDTWGEGTVWNELESFLGNSTGRILDIACGTGVMMQRLSKISGAELHGCDISDALLSKAVERGIEEARLTQCDATVMPYDKGYFEHAYSIGSLEHFPMSGIESLMGQTARIVTGSVMHMVPVSRSGRDEGWIKRYQTYYNNSIEWWIERCRTQYAAVSVLDSRWEDDISVGKWFVCTTKRTDVS